MIVFGGVGEIIYLRLKIGAFVRWLVDDVSINSSNHLILLITFRR